jgi:hypothetical protein
MNNEKCVKCGPILGAESTAIPNDVLLPMGITISVRQFLPNKCH